MKALIFGANGQDGVYLTSLLKQEGITVIGIDRSRGSHQVDISNLVEIERLIRDTQPDYIFHFAANSTTWHGAWTENHDTISTGTMNILESVKQFSPTTKIFLSGSGLQFCNKGKPIRETDEFAATSVYSVSRIHTVFAARYYRTLGVMVYVGYFFNHDSPLRTERHINKKITATVNRIAMGSKEKLEIGDLNVRKEYGFAGDIVRAVWTLVNQDLITEAVIGTGVAYSIRDWIEICFRLKSMNWEEHVIARTDFIPEYEMLVSDPSTMFSLGWRPQVSIHELAQMMLN